MQIQVISQADIVGDQEDLYAYGKERGKRFIITEHAGVKLQWNVPARLWGGETEANANIFDQVNAYFAYLPQDVQLAIFNSYRSIHDVLNDPNAARGECDNIVEAIRPLAAELYSHIEPANYHHWVWNILKPRVPSDISTHFDANAMPGTRERTYLLEDYKGLIPLAIIVRAACPFWFDFLALTKNVMSREHKDMHTFSLIEESWPALSPAFKRLEEFVDHTIGNDRNNPAAILMGIASDDFVYWVLSSLIVNRLPVVDVLGVNIGTPVVSALYNYVRHRVQTIMTSQPPVKNKFADTSMSADENNQSILESFRNRIPLTVGQEAMGDYYLEKQIEMIRKGGKVDPTSLLERVAPGIDRKLVLDALESSKVLLDCNLSDEQITIASWLFHPYSQARTVGNLLKNRVVELLGLAQAVLLHHGMKELAQLVTANYVRLNTAGDVAFIGESITSLRATDRERFRSVFPLEQKSRNLKNIKNQVINDVYEIVRSLQEYDIDITFSEETLRATQGDSPNRRFFIRRDAVMMFMDFAKYLAEREIVRIDPDAVYERLIAGQTNVKVTTVQNPFGNIDWTPNLSVFDHHASK